MVLDTRSVAHAKSFKRKMLSARNLTARIKYGSVKRIVWDALNFLNKIGEKMAKLIHEFVLWIAMVFAGCVIMTLSALFMAFVLTIFRPEELQSFYQGMQNIKSLF